MCMRENSEHACELEKRVDSLDKRVTSLERNLTDLRTEMRTGFNDLKKVVTDMSNTVNERVNIIEKRIVDEKIEWGKVFRKITTWTVATILALAATAAGLNFISEILPFAK